MGKASIARSTLDLARLYVATRESTGKKAQYISRFCRPVVEPTYCTYARHKPSPPRHRTCTEINSNKIHVPPTKRLSRPVRSVSAHQSQHGLHQQHGTGR